MRTIPGNQRRSHQAWSQLCAPIQSVFFQWRECPRALRQRTSHAFRRSLLRGRHARSLQRFRRRATLMAAARLWASSFSERFRAVVSRRPQLRPPLDPRDGKAYLSARETGAKMGETRCARVLVYGRRRPATQAMRAVHIARPLRLLSC